METLKTNFWEKVQLKETEVDKEHGFLFNVYNPKIEGAIFISTILIIPFISLLIFRFAFGMGKDGAEWLALLNQGIWIISGVVGGFILYTRQPRLFMKSGLFIFYAFLIIPFISVLIGSMIIGMIPSLSYEDDNGVKKLTETATIVSTWFQILGEIIVIGMAFAFTIDLKERVIKTFKQNWKQLLIVVFVGSVIMIGICIFAYSAIAQALGAGQSQNQESLEGLLGSSNKTVKIVYTITLFVLTVMMAPLAEELTARHAVFVGSGNRTVGLIVATLFFGMLHVSSGDVEQLPSYLIAGLILSTVFSISRGNITYNWLIHALYNFTALMMIISK
ncbi:CPBP family intramembrane glutamic endopeptidase [[Acholeplasma] multilocale]|uniref:CPBP family intramembrane glutamic endopeptidase n=1 Tax=[Acholeplasma] multilocale TaxID=264638 RepID=UPI000479D2FB|nr:CPBP family intramembrane glutamic endopeptidase [[Acholeplasma] multilocale]